MPDENEILTIKLPEEALPLVHAIEGNAIAVPTINAAAFEDEHIVALFVASQQHAGRILIQNFYSQQILTRKGTFVLDGNTFKALTDPVFTVGTKARRGCGGRAAQIQKLCEH